MIFNLGLVVKKNVQISRCIDRVGHIVKKHHYYLYIVKILPSAKPSQPEAAMAALGKICEESIVAVPAVMYVVGGHWGCGLANLSG